jgi:hypothetical protein
MHGGMPFSRSSALPEKMISTRPISVPSPNPQWSCRDLTLATNQTRNLR